MHVSNKFIVASLHLLENNLPQSDHCYHDSAAKQHVFHDQSVFDCCQLIDSLSVKGFGHDIFTVAIGQGYVHLCCAYNNCITKTIISVVQGSHYLAII